MTDEARLEAIKRLAARHIANTATQEAARASLVRKGIYTANGELAPEYGGSEPRREPVVRRR